jgi:hypothetical protein
VGGNISEIERTKILSFVAYWLVFSLSYFDMYVYDSITKLPIFVMQLGLSFVAAGIHFLLSSLPDKATQSMTIIFICIRVS